MPFYVFVKLRLDGYDFFRAVEEQIIEISKQKKVC